MKSYFCVFLILYAETESSIYTNLKDGFISLFKSFDDSSNIKERTANVFEDKLDDYGRQNADAIDARSAKNKAKLIGQARSYEKRLNYGKSLPNLKDSLLEKDRFHKDPVLNNMRRFIKDKKYLSSSGSASSSAELRDWKDEWKDYWLQKKFEAMNTTQLEGDRVNMVAARPWGVPCGDPNQHDMPWGTCMLAMECDTEYRIYRGDYFCGRTSFVCCALQYTNYDLYQGMDVSFSDSAFDTDSKEKARQFGKRKRKKKDKEKKRRKRDRLNRKRAIKRLIRRIIREIRKMLSRTYRNGTLARKKKTKELKKYIKFLKDKYKKDRKAVKSVHELEMIKINEALKKRLIEITIMNANFMKNATFKEIVSNWTMTKKGARMLLQAYPELESYISSRRSGKRENAVAKTKELKDYLDYDIEYGLLYH